MGFTKEKKFIFENELEIEIVTVLLMNVCDIMTLFRLVFIFFVVVVVVKKIIHCKNDHNHKNVQVEMNLSCLIQSAKNTYYKMFAFVE